MPLPHGLKKTQVTRLVSGNARPRTNRPFGERQTTVGDHEIRFEHELQAESCALRTRPVRGIKREKARLWPRQIHFAGGAAETLREKLLVAIVVGEDEHESVAIVKRLPHKLLQARGGRSLPLLHGRDQEINRMRL